MSPATGAQLRHYYVFCQVVFCFNLLQIYCLSKTIPMSSFSINYLKIDGSLDMVFHITFMSTHFGAFYSWDTFSNNDNSVFSGKLFNYFLWNKILPSAGTHLTKMYLSLREMVFPLSSTATTLKQPHATFYKH